MRSADGHIAGNGMATDNYDENESYFDKRVHVKLTNDYEGLSKEGFDELCADLAGDIVFYFTGREQSDFE